MMFVGLGEWRKTIARSLCRSRSSRSDGSSDALAFIHDRKYPADLILVEV